MILLLAIACGLPLGLAWSHFQGRAYRAPELRAIWFVVLSFLLQSLVLYVPAIRQGLNPALAAVWLPASMLAFLAFAWLNRGASGMKFLLVGLLFNLIVIASNGGFMPISPQTATQLVSSEKAGEVQVGERIGLKDTVLGPDETHFQWLDDRFLTPAGFPFRAAFSLGDMLIAAGVFILLVWPAVPAHQTIEKRIEVFGS